MINRVGKNEDLPGLRRTPQGRCSRLHALRTPAKIDSSHSRGRCAADAQCPQDGLWRSDNRLVPDFALVLFNGLWRYIVASLPGDFATRRLRCNERSRDSRQSGWKLRQAGVAETETARLTRGFERIVPSFPHMLPHRMAGSSRLCPLLKSADHTSRFSKLETSKEGLPETKIGYRRVRRQVASALCSL